MVQRYRSAGVVAVTVLMAVVAGACGTGVDTAEVSSRSAASGASLPTSTTIARSGNGSGSGSGSSSSSASSSKAKATNASSQDLAGTAQQLLARLASDPTLVQQLTGADSAALSRLTGIDPATLARLQITPDTVKALASILTGLDPTSLQKLTSTGKLDPKVATTILTLAAQLDPASAIALKGVDPLAIASLISAATTVDPKVLTALGSVLQVADPNGLGKLAGDKSSLAILAVLFGVALRTDPSQFSNLANAANLDPNVDFVLNSVSGLVSSFTPQLVIQLNGLAKVLGPDLLKALSAVLGILGRPDVAPVIQKAAADPVVLVSTLGTFALLIPGLAETLAPDVFGSNPQARYGALAGLIAIAIANLNGLDLNALAKQLGLPPLSSDFGG